METETSLPYYIVYQDMPVAALSTMNPADASTDFLSGSFLYYPTIYIDVFQESLSCRVSRQNALYTCLLPLGAKCSVHPSHPPRLPYVANISNPP